MKVKEGFKLRELGGEYIIVGEGLAQVNFTKMIVLNQSAAYLWKSIEGMEFTVQTLTDLLLAEYDVTAELAASDAARIAQKWMDAGLVSDATDA